MGTNLTTSQAKVLVIDDERLLRNTLKKILEKAGFYVETAMDYPSAKKCVTGIDFDLFLVDIILPKMNGIQLMKRLQKEFEISGGIIFITGEPNLSTCIDSIRIGADNYLEKPINKQFLIEAIKQTLIRRKHEITIISASNPKKITLDQSFLTEEEEDIDDKTIKKLNEVESNIHEALLTLKKKFGKEFTEEQRSLLNIIASNNSILKKSIKKK